jgi:hypothetical protein
LDRHPSPSQPPSGKNPDFGTPVHYADFREAIYNFLGQIHSYLGHGFENTNWFVTRDSYFTVLPPA